MSMSAKAKILQAQIRSIPLGDRRGAQRWRLRFATVGDSAEGSEVIEVHDLSERGLRMETRLELEVGETISIDLPGAGRSEARVVWRDGSSCGCEFLRPLDRSVVGRIILRTPSTEMEMTEPSRKELAIGVNPSVEAIAAWKRDFERTRAPLGQRIVGYRQHGDGLTVAIVEHD
jgi:hypothetical protein